MNQPLISQSMLKRLNLSKPTLYALLKNEIADDQFAYGLRKFKRKMNPNSFNFEERRKIQSIIEPQVSFDSSDTSNYVVDTCGQF